MLVFNIELITRWVKKKKIRTLVSNHLCYILSLLSVVLCCLNETGGKSFSAAYFILLVWNMFQYRSGISMILRAIYSVSFHHLKWVQNGFVIIPAAWSEFKLQFFCCWWKRILYLSVVVAGIEFHGDNKLRSEFVIMCHRSYNAIIKRLVLSWPYSYQMVFVIIWKYASNVFILRARTVIKLSREKSEHFRKYRWRAAKSTPFLSSFPWHGVAAKTVCKSCACRIFCF